jgi:hypothetical protein
MKAMARLAIFDRKQHGEPHCILDLNSSANHSDSEA